MQTDGIRNVGMIRAELVQCDFVFGCPDIGTVQTVDYGLLCLDHAKELEMKRREIDQRQMDQMANRKE